MSDSTTTPLAPAEHDGGTDDGRFRRRELLIAGGLLTASGAIASVTRKSDFFERALRGPGGATPSLTLKMLRPDDMLAIDLELYNLRLQSGPPRLVRINSNADAFVVAVFEPQAIFEEAFRENEGNTIPVDPPPVRAVLSEETRLAFMLTAGTQSIPFDDASLLKWTTFQPSLAPNADPTSGSPRPSLTAPGPTVTGIVAPYKLTLSPGRFSGWAHSSEPVTHDGRTELWHTRLGYRAFIGDIHKVRETEPSLKSVRAIHSPDWRQSQPQRNATDPFPLNSMDNRDRSEIVGLSSDFGISGYQPTPITARNLMLTSQGAWTDLSANFNGPESQFDVVHFSHRGTMGREHFVKVVKRGFLWPLGHRAVKIQITERKFEPIKSGSQSGKTGAYLRRRDFIVVTERNKTYNSRKFPFAAVEIMTDRTPNLDGFTGDAGIKSGADTEFGEDAFWPRVSGRDFEFDVVATDIEGVQAKFSTPLIFVNGTTAAKQANLVRLRTAYNLTKNEDRRTSPLAGQSIAYAPPSEGKSRDTAFETDTIELNGEITVNPLGFQPVMENATIRVPAIQNVAAAGASARRRAARARGEVVERRGPANEAGAVVVKMAEEYVKDAFDDAKNQAQAYLKLAEAEALDYAKDAAADACGAIGIPNMDVVGLSRSVGTIGGDLINGKLPDLSQFKPEDFLAGAKFLGIDFASVLEDAIGFPLPDVDDITKVPQQLVETVYEGVEELEGVAKDLENRIPKELRTELIWEPDLQAQKGKNPVFIPENQDGTGAKMRLYSLTVVPINRDLDDPLGEPQVEVTGEISNFGLKLFGDDPFLALYFNRFSFESRNGQKPKIDVEIRDVTFSGALEFVNELRELMSYSGNGLTIDVSPQRVKAAYALEVPTITAGIFTLANIALNASVAVPFNGDVVSAKFGFCSQDRPFLLTYTIFGGGGYALAEVNANGVEKLEVSLEFGASASIDLGVASGSVSIMAGTIIAVGKNPMAGKPGQPDLAVGLTGFVRLNGELDVLGVISVSLEFNLSLTYDSLTEEAWGRAVLTVEVDVTLFSKTVEIECEKRFGGGKASAGALRARGRRRGGGASEPDSQPISFGQVFPETASNQSDEWNTYVSAFAQEAF